MEKDTMTSITVTGMYRGGQEATGDFERLGPWDKANGRAWCSFSPECNRKQRVSDPFNFSLAEREIDRSTWPG